MNRNKVVKLDENIKTVYFGGTNARSATPIVREGGSFGDLIAYQWKKDAKGNYMVNADGTPYTTDKAGELQAYIGNFNPKATLGLNNTFRFKAFSLSALIDGRFGGTMVSGTEMNLAFSGIPEVTENYTARADGA